MGQSTNPPVPMGVYAQKGGDPERHDKALLQAEAVFFHQFGTMLGLGVPVLSSLEILLRQARDPRLKQAVEALREVIARGGTLAEGLDHPVFSGMVIAIARVGEISGQVDKAMLGAALCLEKQATLL